MTPVISPGGLTDENAFMNAGTPTSTTNPLGMDGIEFVEFSSPSPDVLAKLFRALGFSHTMRHRVRPIDLYRQNDIVFLLNREPGSAAAGFSQRHGPSICAMGWRFANPEQAQTLAVERGATHAEDRDYPLPAVRGIGESLIYFVGAQSGTDFYTSLGFEPLSPPEIEPSKGFISIDHLTNNVPNGELGTWSDFYRKVFGFVEVRYFDIRGARTGLQSHALRSPCGKFCIPINEAREEKSQINEYLREHRGPGVQHLAFLTNDILASLKALAPTGIGTLDMDADYYEEAFRRVPQVTEDRAALRQYNVLVDGDAEGYLLQIFTKNLIGPIFIEIIQRKNHLSFGEGNFGALFRSIERDQEKRGAFG